MSVNVKKKAVIVGLALIVAGVVLYYELNTSQPPCPSCHVENLAPLSAGAAAAPGSPTDRQQLCRLNGRIREDWSQPGGGALAVQLEGTVAALSGLKPGDCVDLPMVCPAKSVVPALAFRDEKTGANYQNDLCAEPKVCDHCP